MVKPKTFIKSFAHVGENRLIEEVNKYAKDNNLNIKSFQMTEKMITTEMVVLFEEIEK